MGGGPSGRGVTAFPGVDVPRVEALAWPAVLEGS